MVPDTKINGPLNQGAMETNLIADGCRNLQALNGRVFRLNWLGWRRFAWDDDDSYRIPLKNNRRRIGPIKNIDMPSRTGVLYLYFVRLRTFRQ